MEGKKPDLVIIHFGSDPRFARGFDMMFSGTIARYLPEVTLASYRLEDLEAERAFLERVERESSGCRLLIVVSGPASFNDVRLNHVRFLHYATAYRADNGFPTIPVIFGERDDGEYRDEGRLVEPLRQFHRVVIPYVDIESALASGSGLDLFWAGEDSAYNRINSLARLSSEILAGPRGQKSKPPIEPPDLIKASVFSPRLAALGDELLVQAHAYLPGQERIVREKAARADRSAEDRGSQELGEGVSKGERLGFHLQMRGVEIDEPDQEYEWKGEPLAAQFSVLIPQGSEPRSAVGTVIVTKGGVPIGHIKFTLRVVTREEKAKTGAALAEEAGELSPYRTAFVSYASKDREKVMPRVQAFAAAGIKVFQDILGLEPGERWAQGLYKHIDESDVFYLFWSKAAKRSKWVRKEAQYAHNRQHGSEYAPPEIIPIIIEGPPPVEPPPELNFLHFNDKYIYLMAGVKVEAKARRKRV